MTERRYVQQPDDIFVAVDRTVKLLNYMLGERSQLYGTVIYLMQMLEMNKVVMPPVEAMKEYHKSFIVSFDVEGNDFVVRLIDRPDDSQEDLIDGDQNT